MRLNVDVRGGAGELLPGIADRAERPQPGLKVIADAMRSRESKVFATADGGSWDPLAPGTVARKGSARVLVDDGGLLRSLTVRGDRYHVERVTVDGLEVGTKNPVAHLHRDGARGMPKRNPVPPITASERSAFAEDLRAYLVEGQT